MDYIYHLLYFAWIILVAKTYPCKKYPIYLPIFFPNITIIMTISHITAKTSSSACMAQQPEKFPSLSHTSLLFFKVNWFVDFIANRQRLSPGGGGVARKRFSSSTSRGSMVKVDRNSGRFNVPELKVSKSNRTLRYSCSPIHLEQVSIRHHICR